MLVQNTDFTRGLLNTSSLFSEDLVAQLECVQPTTRIPDSKP